MTDKEIRYDIYQPFGPNILKVNMPNHFTRHSYIVKPVVGDFYLFPSWLAHQVYPFRSKGERRSMAFNVHFKLDGPVKGINA